MADVIAEVARNEIGLQLYPFYRFSVSDDETSKQKWPQVLQFLDLCIRADSADMKLTAMILIEDVPNIFGVDQDRYLQGIKVRWFFELVSVTY